MPDSIPGSDAAAAPAGASSARTTLLRLTRIARRNLLPLIVCLVAVPAAALGFSLTQQKQYEASASLLFRDPELDQKLFGSSLKPTDGDPQRTAATNLQLISLQAVAQRTARTLAVPGLDSADVRSSVTVKPRGESDVLTVTATDPDPRLAARMANTFAAEYIVFRRQADRAKVREAQALVEKRLDELPPGEVDGPEGAQLTRRARELEILASLQTGNAELVERAQVPSSPSSPKPARNVLLGILFGALLGVGLVSVREQLDRRLRDPEDALEVLDEPILASIPDSRSLSPRAERPGLLSGPDVEAFIMLRTNLRYYNLQRELRSILVTSPESQDGKTVVSWNLASAEARAGTRVLYVEADLRHPTLGAQLGVDSTAGLTHLLTGAMEPEEAIVRVGPLDVLLAGTAPSKPAELLGSRRMLRLLEWAENRYERVVIDTPPSVEVADAIPLMNRVSGLIVVIRLRRSSREAALALRQQLDNVHAPVLGLVLNGGRRRRRGYLRQTEAPAEPHVDAGLPLSDLPDPGRGREPTGRRVARRERARLPSIERRQ